MAIRYDGEDPDTTNLSLAPLPYPNSAGHLPTLLRWHQLDPPDEEEVLRNSRVQELQGNRNPFVDLPNLASRVFSEK